MTRISRISVARHCNDLGGKVWNPVIHWTQKYAVFVVIEDDSGRLGFGECWCFDTAPDALIAYLRTEVVPYFLGLNLDEVEGAASQLTSRATLTARHGMLASALSGIDIAVWDLRARQQDQPIWAHLNSSGNGRVSLYSSGGLYGNGKTTADLVDEMRGMASDGFRLSKMKIGAESIPADVDRVRSVLDALPPDAKLIVDGVYSYSANDAGRLYEALPEDRIEAFQSPTKAWDYAGMAALSRAGIPVMATEAEYRPELHCQLIEEAEVAFLQTAPIACGGISRVRDLADLVEGTSTRLSLEVSSTAIALMAACQLAAADDAIAHVEYHTVHQVFFDDLKLQRQHAERDSFSLPDQIGLGIALPRDEVDIAFSLADTNTVQESHKAV